MATLIFIPHYNTPDQLAILLKQIPRSLYSQILLVDDGSSLSPQFPSKITLIQHKQRKGYGAAQKTAYQWFLDSEYDQIILLHGDNQYDFQTLWDAKNISHPVQIASRRLKPSPEAYYPFWRKRGNQLLTGFANQVFRTQYTDLHSGGRIYTKKFLETVPFMEFEDGFLFDQQILALCLQNQISIDEFSIAPRYDSEVSSISFRDSIRYGLGCVRILLQKSRLKN